MKNIVNVIDLQVDRLKVGIMIDIFLQCFYNLQEKHDCGGITDKEWCKIVNKYERSCQKYGYWNG